MAENVVEHAHAEAEAVIAEAQAIADSAAAELEASQPGTPSQHGVASSNVVIPAAPIVPELSAEERARREMNRREFLMYSWVGALGLVSAVGGYSMFAFMYPRFREGEFGGKFREDQGKFSADGSPGANPDGKFWMVTTTDGEPKAIYMVCTHLGCLYKWVGSNNRFECPCHGSKFNRDGYYIEGPAPRSLDSFKVAVENGQVVVDTGAKETGKPAAESPAKVSV